MARVRKCRMCPSQDARDVEVLVTIAGHSRKWMVHVCKWDWRAFEAMLDSADPMPQLGLDSGLVPARQFLW